MATLTTALDTPFDVPAIGLFNVQSTGGPAMLWRKNSAGAAWAPVGIVDGAREVNHGIGGASYKFTAALTYTATVQADQ